MRLILAIWAARLSALFCRLAGKKATATPGAVALKICPDLVRRLSAKVTLGICVTCGTNGKTTTNNLLAAALRDAGHRVVCNSVGANMLSGVASSLAAAAGLFGGLRADYACLEVDEALTVQVFKYLTPGVMIVTNLFRDQLDRFGEIDITMRYLSRAIGMLPDVRLALNGDDPLTVFLGQESGRDCAFFGIDENVGIALEETREGRFCKKCGAQLEYKYYQYGQLGDYSCPMCGFARPAVDMPAVNVDASDGLAFDVNGAHLFAPYRGFYNIYNILAAYTALTLLGADTSGFVGTLARYQPQIGRMEIFDFGKPLLLNLSKNPIGFNQNISALLQDGRRKDVIVMINDGAQDGRDISWLWDVDFERIRDANVARLLACGGRMYDLAVRFKYAGLPVAGTAADMERLISACLASDAEVLYVLTNYTALFPTQILIKKMHKAYQMRKGGGRDE